MSEHIRLKADQSYRYDNVMIMQTTQWSLKRFEVKFGTGVPLPNSTPFNIITPSTPMSSLCWATRPGSLKVDFIFVNDWSVNVYICWIPLSAILSCLFLPPFCHSVPLFPFTIASCALLHFLVLFEQLSFNFLFIYEFEKAGHSRVNLFTCFFVLFVSRLIF